MIRWLLPICLLLIAVPAYAESIDSSDLSPTEIAQINAEAAGFRLQHAKDNTAGHDVTTGPVATVDQYKDFGHQYGAALASVAAELGTTPDKLMQTDVGHTAMLLIVWKMAGHKMLAVISGLVWFVVMLPLWFYILYRTIFKPIRVEETFWETGKVQSRILIRFGPKDTEFTTSLILFGLVLGIICLVGVLMIFVF